MSKSIIVLLLALAITGCQSGSTKQQDSESNSPKKIGEAPEGGLFSSVFNKGPSKSIVLPPDLVSSANETVKQNHEEGTLALSERVLPDVIGATIISEEGRRWLKVDANAQAVWDTLAEFWAAEQVDLVEYKPAAGLMETDWFETSSRSERDKNRKLAAMFDRITGSGVSYDKFKIRLEKEGEEVTNIFVTHRTTKRLESEYSGQKVTDWQWVEGESDEEKIAQLLQVMVLLFESGSENPA
ncbi:MAG: outer membrane protein assembly factor BamC [bacterium]